MNTSVEDSHIVADLMTEDPISVGPGDRVGRVRDLILALGFNAVPVRVDDDVVGIVTSTDLAEDWPDDETVATVMTRSPHAIDAEAGVREAADLMIERRIHHLMVESGGQVIGILSSLDLLHALAYPSRGQ